MITTLILGLMAEEKTTEIKHEEAQKKTQIKQDRRKHNHKKTNEETQRLNNKNRSLS